MFSKSYSPISTEILTNIYLIAPAKPSAFNYSLATQNPLRNHSLRMPSVSSTQIPRQAVGSGFSISSGFDMDLKNDASGALVLSPKKPWKPLAYSIAIGASIYLFEPVIQIISRLVTGLPAHPSFLREVRGGILFCCVAFGALLSLFYYISRKWTPATRFDRAGNLILRHTVETKTLGAHARIEEARIKLSESRAIQLCYGDFVKGDSESPGYDWWQLLIVGPGDPPYRAILAQSAARNQITKAGQQIAAYLSVPFIDDADFRDAPNDSDEISYGVVDPQGMFVTTASSTDPRCDPVEVAQASQRALHRHDRRNASIALGVIVAVALAIGIYVQLMSGLDWWDALKADLSRPMGPD
jgi:hypothetical protein